MVLDDGSGMISDSRLAIGDFRFYKSQIAYRPIHTEGHPVPPCLLWVTLNWFQGLIAGR